MEGGRVTIATRRAGVYRLHGRFGDFCQGRHTSMYFFVETLLQSTAKGGGGVQGIPIQALYQDSVAFMVFCRVIWWNCGGALGAVVTLFGNCGRAGRNAGTVVELLRNFNSNATGGKTEELLWNSREL